MAWDFGTDPEYQQKLDWAARPLTPATPRSSPSTAQVLRDYKPVDGLWPSEHLPARLAAARAKYAAYLENEVGNL